MINWNQLLEGGCFSDKWFNITKFNLQIFLPWLTFYLIIFISRNNISLSLIIYHISYHYIIYISVKEGYEDSGMGEVSYCKGFGFPPKNSTTSISQSKFIYFYFYFCFLNNDNFWCFQCLPPCFLEKLSENFLKEKV